MANPAVVCPIDMTWHGDFELSIKIPEILTWTVELRHTTATRLFTRVGSKLPDSLSVNPAVLRVLGPLAGTVLGAGRIRLGGTMPNGQQFRIAPKQLWAVSATRATLEGRDLGDVVPLPEQARLGGFWAPQRGLAVVGQGRFDAFDPDRHRGAAELICRQAH